MHNPPPSVNLDNSGNNHCNTRYFENLNESLKSGESLSGTVGILNAGFSVFFPCLGIITGSSASYLHGLNIILVFGAIFLIIRLFLVYESVSHLDNFQCFSGNSAQEKLTSKISTSILVDSLMDLCPGLGIIGMVHKSYMSKTCKKFDKNLINSSGILVGK